MIIDFHTHTFPEKIAAQAVERMSQSSGLCYEAALTPKALSQTMAENGIDLSINLPVMTKASQVEKVNSAMIAQQEAFSRLHILSFGGMHPEYPHYQQELRRLRTAGIKGIKIHPAFQGTTLDDIRYLRIIEAACAEGLIVVTHAGLDIGISEYNYATPQMILNVINTVHPDHLVLAHMGCWGSWERDFSCLAGAPVYLDTAFSLGKIRFRSDAPQPPLRERNLTPAQFTHFVRQHGADKILFATDSPWENGKAYRSFIQSCGLTSTEQALIFSQNAQRLLRI